ncbi:MAG: M48 family metallopeptidase [Deltaproteobacteria bacterium]|nr:M48 family metallopeptidase [Deltaproteobacteria bacterium]
MAIICRKPETENLKSRSTPWVALLVALTAAAACASVPYTDRRQLLLVSEGREVAMGYQAFQQIRRQYRPEPDPELNYLVNQVGRRLAAAVDRPDFAWEFVVFRDDKITNAFCLPGGKVGVFTGILPYTQDETGMATVIAHETAHVLARHAGERLSHAMLAQMGGLGLSLGLGSVNPYAGQAIAQGYGLGTQMGILLPYSRKQESEADRIGLILMAKAGYDPEGAIVFWERMMQKDKDKTRLPQVLSSHPTDENRILAMKEFLPQARQYYRETPGAAQTQAPPPPPKVETKMSP